MDGKTLKDSILQMAVQGKLVAQDPNDEPVSKLIEHIREMRDVKIAAGELKKSRVNNTVICRDVDGSWIEYELDAKGDKSNPKSIDDEIYLEIPDSWTWIRLGDIGDWGAGATPAKGNPQYHVDGTIPWLMTGDLNDGIVTDVPKKITDKALEECSLKLNPVGSVLVAMYGATIGKLGILGIPSTTNQACCACVLFDEDMRDYLFNFLMSYRDRFVIRGEGSAQPNISRQKIVSTLMPLPPLAEQQRIVKALNYLMPFVDRYGELEEKREQLDAELPERLRESLLQAAVQGQLVKQDAEEEPASKLLERIREGRAERIKSGELKAPKGGESVIGQHPDGSWWEYTIDKKGKKSEAVCIDEEIPFDIPDSWIWARMGCIGDWKAGSTPSKSKHEYYHNGTVPYALISDLNDGYVETIEKSITQKAVDDCRLRLNPVGSVMVAMYMSIGKAGILAIPTTTNQSICVCIPTIMQMNKWIFTWVLSQRSALNEKGAGSTQKNISKEKLEHTLIPVPPLEEQQRIVAKLDEMLPELEKIV